MTTPARPWSTRQKASARTTPATRTDRDYGKVDPEYGTEDDLRSLRRRCPQARSRVLLDLVYAYCGPTSVLMEHAAFIQPRRGREGGHRQLELSAAELESKGLREYLWVDMEYSVKEFQVDDTGHVVSPIRFRWTSGWKAAGGSTVSGPTW